MDVDPTIVGAGVTATAVIVAAAIGLRARSPRASGTLSENVNISTFFLLGANVAKLGWGKVAGPTGPMMGDRERRDMEILNLEAMSRLRFPDSITTDVTAFVHEPIELKELGEALAQIRRLVGLFVRSRHGDRPARTYDLGFDVVNACPMLEMASVRVPEGGPIAIRMVRELVRDADKLGLPTKDLRDALKQAERGIASGTSGSFDEARVKVIAAGCVLEEKLGGELLAPGR